MGVKVVTDSTSYIDKELAEELDIRVLPLYVSFEDESMRENEIENKLFFKKMEEKGIPVSSQPSIGELYKAMVDIVSKGDDLLCIFLSSEMSGTYNSACKVRDKVLEEYKDRRIYVLDSRSNSMQLGFSALVAARAAKSGKDIEEVRNIAEDNIERSRFIFVPDNLKYLKKGGRIGGAGALIGGILKIIPVLTVEEGKTTVFKTVRTKMNAVKAMIDKVLEDNKDYRVEEILVHHIDAYEQAQVLRDRLEEELELNVGIEDIGPVIGLHVGPGALGIAYYTEKKLI